jgi:hypothetical protein
MGASTASPPTLIEWSSRGKNARLRAVQPVEQLGDLGIGAEA